MASGHVTALTGRTHGCTDPQSDVKILLANSEPSTHGTKRTCRGELAHIRFEGRSGLADVASAYDPLRTSAAPALIAAGPPSMTPS